jgi:two-component system, NtrC family, sensor kinase
MNQHLQSILAIIEGEEGIDAALKESVIKSIKAVEKELEITIFKLDRTEKVKRTTAILLEETIEELEQKRKAIEETNVALQLSLAELKSAQAQLIQSEKMASLGELTAGVAHEIQNPLNFINNFSEVNAELIEEMDTEVSNGNITEAQILARNIRENNEKITFHGKRADSIVKNMLQHSRKNTGEKELTDINALADEFLRLSYHGLRAKDKLFNASMKTDFDSTIGNIPVVGQDISRVLMNLYNNAFYSVNEKKKLQNGQFEPLVEVSTKRVDDAVEIRVSDNGLGIPQQVLDKIYQPFFTTKPTGEGTGLGLSMSYEIIKNGHNGDLQVSSKEGEFAIFIIKLPLQTLTYKPGL